MKTIEKFISELNTDIDVLNLIDIDNIDYSDAFYSIYEMIDDNGGFNINIIYCSNAIDYLSKYDPSLRDSLEIALDMGFSLNAINSEILASLLASQNAREDFYELEDEINNFFADLEKKEGDIYEFICPVYYLPYIFNADVDNITEEEINRIDEVLSGYCCFSVKDIDNESFFSHQNDFNRLGADCVTLTALKND